MRRSSDEDEDEDEDDSAAAAAVAADDVAVFVGGVVAAGAVVLPPTADSELDICEGNSPSVFGKKGQSQTKKESRPRAPQITERSRTVGRTIPPHDHGHTRSTRGKPPNRTRSPTHESVFGTKNYKTDTAIFFCLE